MKKTSAKLAAIAATAFMTACGGSGTRTEPPQPGTADAVKASKKVILTATFYACMRDDHLATLGHRLSFPVIERPGNPVTADEIEQLEDAYLNTTGKAIDGYLQTVTGKFKYETLRQNGGDFRSSLGHPENGLSTGDVAAVHQALQNGAIDMARQHAAFLEAVGKILKGNNGGYAEPAHETWGLSPDISPKCKP